jgi:hypothetical protein
LTQAVGTSGLETVFINWVATTPLADKVTVYVNFGWGVNRTAELNTTTWNSALECAVTATALRCSGSSCLFRESRDGVWSARPGF